MVTGQDSQLFAVLIVVQADGARVVRVHRLVELGHRQRVQHPLGQPVAGETPVVGPAPVQLTAGQAGRSVQAN